MKQLLLMVEINARFKKLSGSSLEDTAAKHRKEAERLQKEIDAQQPRMNAAKLQ
jgi:hypothetical protein